MKNFQQNLLVILSLGLCGLCAWQWYVQTQLHISGEDLEAKIFKQASDIQTYTNSIRNMDSEIAGLSERINELKQEAVTNREAALKQEREIFSYKSSLEIASNSISQYKNVVAELEAKLKEASAGIEKQNDAIKQLVSERDDVIKRYNDAIKSQHELAEKYNNLVDRYNKLQAAGAAEPAKP